MYEDMTTFAWSFQGYRSAYLRVVHDALRGLPYYDNGITDTHG